MRVQFLGDLAGTGFGTVTMDLGRELLALGHDVRFVSQNEMGDALPEPFNTRTFQLNDPAGWLRLTQLGKLVGLMQGSVWSDDWAPEACLVVGDYASVFSVFGPDPAACEIIPIYHYVPIEGVGLPPAWGNLWSRITPVAQTEFGAIEIEKVTGSRPEFVYHGVNSRDFWPVSPERPIYIWDKKLHSKADCKRLLRGGSSAPPETRWILRADRHVPRKLYPAWIRCLAPVLAERRDTFAIYHCKTTDQGGNIKDSLSKLPDWLAARFVSTGFHDQIGGADRDLLNVIYNAADLYVSISAEGFGLTIAEAMACGVPAVGLDFSAVPEVVGPGGRLAPVGYLLDNPYDYFWAGPNERETTAIVRDMIDKPDVLREYGRAGAAHVRETFTWSAAARKFTEIMEPARVEAIA